MKSLKSLILCLLAGLIIHQTSFGQTNRVTNPENTPVDPALGIRTVNLWDDAVPYAKGDAYEDVPTLTAFLPHMGTGNGTAVIVAPGGAYLGLASNLEGRQVADWFTSNGITAFVLKYRKGPNYLYPTPLIDAQRAVRWVRAHSSEYSLDPDRVGMIGFSAGGHLTAMTAVSNAYLGTEEAQDTIDRQSAKPDFIILGYPWLNAMQADEPGFIPSYQSLLRIPDDQKETFEKDYTPAYHVTNEMPPVFIWSTTDDKTVPVHASSDFYGELVKAGVPVEMHLFKSGAHGGGLGAADPALEMWPILLSQWMRGLGLL